MKFRHSQIGWMTASLQSQAFDASSFYDVESKLAPNYSIGLDQFLRIEASQQCLNW
jgi:hypothetical protein